MPAAALAQVAAQALLPRSSAAQANC